MKHRRPLPFHLSTVSVRILGVLLMTIGQICQGQETIPVSNPFYIEVEGAFGKLSKAYTGFPEVGMKTAGTLSFGFANTNNTSWGRYFNYPQTGISATVTSLGNKQSLGQQVSLMPYVLFNPIKRMKQPFSFKLGLGAAYFTKHYDAEKNPENRAIGSAFTWAFQWYMYQSVVVGKQYNIKVGLGWDHASTGHVNLPNFGYNSFSFGVAAQVFTRKNAPVYGLLRGKLVEEKRPLSGFISVRQGFGVHQMGGTGPAQDKTHYPVYTVAVSGGVLVHGFVRVRAGVAYRYYQGFYERIVDMNYPAYSQNPTLNASNVNVFVGSEFLLGHFGIDLELGFNAFKPFYRQFYNDYESSKSSKFSYESKQLCTQRIGLNAYLFSIKRDPTHNLSLGAHINANFGQADFSDLALAYTFVIRKKWKQKEQPLAYRSTGLFDATFLRL